MRVDVKWRKQDQVLHKYEIWDYWPANDLRNIGLLFALPVQECTSRVKILRWMYVWFCRGATSE